MHSCKILYIDWEDFWKIRWQKRCIYLDGLPRKDNNSGNRQGIIHICNCSRSTKAWWTYKVLGKSKKEKSQHLHYHWINDSVDLSRKDESSVQINSQGRALKGYLSVSYLMMFNKCTTLSYNSNTLVTSLIGSKKMEIDSSQIASE